jgi:hypothetical protein
MHAKDKRRFNKLSVQKYNFDVFSATTNLVKENLLDDSYKSFLSVAISLLGFSIIILTYYI